MIKFIFAVCLLIPVLTFARGEGHDQGNGGDALLIEDRYYLLDLVEAGVEKNPIIDNKVKPRDDFRQRLENVLSAEFPIDLIAKKLTEIQNVNPLMSFILLKSIEAFQWKIVSSSLLDVVDENTALDIPRANLFQLALRKGTSILIDRSLWEKIDSGNRTALVFHEVLYALVLPEREENAGSFIKHNQYQRSELARELNGYLFSDFARHGQEGLNRHQSFMHITGVDVWFNFKGVYDASYQLLMNPFIQIDISDEWTQLMKSKTSIELGTRGLTKESLAVLEKACVFALKNKLAVQVLMSYGGGVLVLPINSWQPHGSYLRYVDIVNKRTRTEKMLNQSFTSKDDCLKKLKSGVGAKVEWIYDNYK